MSATAATWECLPPKFPLDASAGFCYIFTMIVAGIYAICLTRPDGAKGHYVGQSRNVNKRLCSHRHYLRKGRHANPHLQAAWVRYGEAAFSFRLIETVEANADALTAAEERWIAELDARWDRGGFNQRIAANSNRGLKKSAESVRRSNAHRKGVPLSETHKAAIGAANRGRGPTPECIRLALEARARRPNPRLGKPDPRKGMPLSEEAKQRQSEGQKRRWAARKAEAAARPEMLGEAA